MTDFDKKQKELTVKLTKLREEQNGIPTKKAEYAQARNNAEVENLLQREKMIRLEIAQLEVDSAQVIKERYEYKIEQNNKRLKELEGIILPLDQEIKLLQEKLKPYYDEYVKVSYRDLTGETASNSQLNLEHHYALYAWKDAMAKLQKLSQEL